MNFAKLLLIYTALILIGACSFTKIAHTYADWIIMGRIDDAFDLSNEQEEWLEPKVTAFMVHIDSKVIPELVVFLRESLERTKDGLKEDDAWWINDTYNQMRAELLDHIADDVGAFLMTLSNDQQNHFGGYLEETNEPMVETLKESDEDAAEIISEKQIDFLEEWFGSLTTDQVAAVKRLRPPSKGDVQRRLTQRRRFQKTVLDAVRAQPGADELTESIRRWAKQPATMLSKEAGDAYLQHRKAHILYLVEIDKLVNEKQRQHLRKKLNGLIADLSELAKPRTKTSE